MTFKDLTISFNRKASLLALISAAILCCNSCALHKILHAEGGRSDISAEEITQTCHPMGIVEDPFHSCSVDGPSKRRLIVYLPADYYTSGKSYPTVYLLHGARGNEISWVDLGNMIAIVDTLMNQGKIQPAIYVMPNMNQYTTQEQGEHSLFKAPIEAFLDTDGAVESAFVHDVVGFIDSHYRTIADKAHRAIAGLSIGSLQSIYITADSPDTFDYVGLFSPIFKSHISSSKYSDFYDMKAVKQKHKIQFSPEHCPKLYIGMIGRNDFYIFHSEYFRQYLTLNHYPYKFIVTSGGHGWDNWTQYLEDFLPMCFN